MNVPQEHKIQRRVAGYHDIRMDGMLELVVRARDASVLDIGCNRGLVGFEMANNGARLVHGCDSYEVGIATARELFADLRAVQSQFECVDLKGGPAAMRPFGNTQYDIVLMLATYHKLKRIMEPRQLTELMQYFGRRTIKFFGWRGTSEKANENEVEMAQIDRDFQETGLRRVHTSHISLSLGLAAIWAKP